MIRLLARALRERALEFSRPEWHPELAPLCNYLRARWKRDPRELPPEAWEEALLELIAERISEGWDAYGAPSVARTPDGKGWAGSFEESGEPYVVEASTQVGSQMDLGALPGVQDLRFVHGEAGPVPAVSGA